MASFEERQLFSSLAHPQHIYSISVHDEPYIDPARGKESRLIFCREVMVSRNVSPIKIYLLQDGNRVIIVLIKCKLLAINFCCHEKGIKALDQKMY